MKTEYYSCDIFEYYYSPQLVKGRNSHVVSCNIYKLIKEVNEFINQVALENIKKGLKECNTKEIGTFSLFACLKVTRYPPNEDLRDFRNKNKVIWNGEYSVEYMKQSFSDTDSLANKRYGETENKFNMWTFTVYETMPRIKQLQFIGVNNSLIKRYPRLETEVMKDYKGTQYKVIKGAHWK